MISDESIITGKKYEMTDYIMPDPNTASDSGAIQEAIRKAKESGTDCVVIPKKKTDSGYTYWEIDKTILLPSDITVVLFGCHLRLRDGVYENIFRNENMYHEETYTRENEQKNIKIIGIGTAVLDGGNANGLTEATSRKNGLPHVRNNNLILLHNVNGYVIEITARGIYSSGAAAVFLGSSLRDSHLSDIHAAGRTLHAVSTYMPEMMFPENGCHIMGGVDMENVIIENVFYSGTADGDKLDDSGSYANRYTFPDQPFSGCALDFRCMREGDRLQNVVFRRIFAPSEEKIGVFANGIVPVIEH